MADADPKTSEEHTRLFLERTRYEGYGADTSTVMPCPFCCAPDNLRVLVLAADVAYKRGATCSTCGRGWRGELTAIGGGMQLEIVQTGGEDPPAYLPPMRRVG